MRVAMTIWGDRVSPVLDCSRNLLVAEIAGGEVVGRKTECFDAGSLPATLRELWQQGVQVLICGAVSQELATVIESCNVKLLPFVAGDVEKILETVAQGGSVSAFAMPGCQCAGRCRGTRRSGCRRNPSGAQR
jgi:predicted Fe-Mo cluster-binding NifX family protein